MFGSLVLMGQVIRCWNYGILGIRGGLARLETLNIFNCMLECFTIWWYVHATWGSIIYVNQS